MASELTGTIKNHVTRLARYQALETYAARVLGGWLAGIARWEVKQRVAYHLWEDRLPSVGRSANQPPTPYAPVGVTCQPTGS